MTSVASLAGTAALIGDPARAAMLVALMDGRALSAGELASTAGVTPATASGHLGRLLHGGLLTLVRQGRHRYYRLAGPAAAGLVEALMSALGDVTDRHRPVRTGPRDKALRQARLCYDHLAGEVAVGMAEQMVGRGHLVLGDDGGALTSAGLAVLSGLDIPLAPPVDMASSAFCRPCLDWSERRHHIGGAVGRAICAGFLSRGWLRRTPAGRALSVTPLGVTELRRHFGVAVA